MSVLLVGEIGQNHNGCLRNALDLIRIAAEPRRADLYGEDVRGVDAVKLTKRSLEHETTRSMAARSYDGRHSFGRTYGQHRAALELTNAEHAEAYRVAKDLGLRFVETICAVQALDLLDHFEPDYVKVASRDLTNHRLVEALAETGIPIVLSTGMASLADLDAALEIVTARHEEVTILHCLSEYPAAPENVNLLTIRWLAERYPRHAIGFSNHSQGLAVPLSAVALGARMLEVHVTLSRQMSGTDQQGSFDSDGLYRLARDVRIVERALGRELPPRRTEASAPARSKLGRSVATSRGLPAGVRIAESDLEPLSPGTGIPWPERDRVVGRWTVHELSAQELLTATMCHARD